LRALAVVPVILFHAGFELFSGGFVGVDVFFVISGYLITTILIEDIENKRFSIVNFYERRARRILPALFFVMLVCIPFAWMWMLPSQMKDFSQSLVAVSLFASNILFWRESGYFAAAAEEKPLLHTWSLAVEEQYYVLFPIFLILAWRFGRNRVFWMIVLMAAISLLLSEWGWRNKATANFYLAPTRAWELFAGSIAAFIVQKQGVQKSNPLATLGLAAIIFSIFFYDETTPFPSVYALVPVLGVVLLVLYADKETFAAKLLSTKGFVGIGLISYSAYLWHQPLFAFARIRSLDDPSFLLMSTLGLISIFLAYFSWRFIEKPFRNKKKINSKSIFVASICMFFLITFASAFLLNQNLSRSPISDKTFSDYGYIEAPREEIGYAECEGLVLSTQCGHSPSASILAWGDSYVKHGIPFVREYEKSAVAQLALSSCPPLIGSLEEPRLNRTSNRITECNNFNKEVMDVIADNLSIKKVVIGSRFTLIEDKSEEQIIELANSFYVNLTLWLNEVNRPLDVAIFPPPPIPNYDPSRCIDKHLMFNLDAVNCNFNVSDFGDFYLKQALFIDVLMEIGLQVYPLERVMCPNDSCISLVENIRVYRDYGHIRNEASEYFGKQALELLPNE
jgi:peptidoglycan/LPS O-acetylase OafA/YrhL